MTNSGILNKLKRQFKSADVLFQLIYINIGVFVIAILSMLICKLFSVDAGRFFIYLELPSSFSYFIKKPWTIITYMFLHYELLHILFNMLWLYCFGRIFLMLFNGRQLGGLYILGGIGGGLFYMLAFNIFPYFNQFPNPSFMLGASASVLAIVVAPAVATPNFQIRLFFLGNIKLKYIAIVTVLLDVYFLSSSGENVGGHIAHLGGALAGLWFALSLSKGKDITLWINKGIDGFFNLFKSKPKMKVSYKNEKKNTSRETDMEYNTRKKSEEEVINRILDKLKKSGYESLSSDEKKTLFNAGK